MIIINIKEEISSLNILIMIYFVSYLQCVLCVKVSCLPNVKVGKPDFGKETIQSNSNWNISLEE